MVIAPLRRKLIGEVLIAKGFITKEQLDQALEEQKTSKELLGKILIKNGVLTEDKLLQGLSVSLGLPTLRLGTEVNIEEEALKLIPESIARTHILIPISKKNNVLKVAMSDPTNIVTVDDIKRLTNLDLSIVLAQEGDIKNAIQRCYGGRFINEKNLSGEDVEEISVKDEEELTDEFGVDDAPVIKYVNSLLFEAVNKRASDIHIEPTELEISVRMRLDGNLRKSPNPPKKYFSAIVSRIKIMANLDIAERRMPQDGKCKIKIAEKKIDVRVSTMPTMYGEKVVMRVLDRSNLTLDMSTMGFSEKNLVIYQESLRKPYGMILVTGPTGSGKTTTLYSGLNFINSPDQNIVSVEDPVEYELKGINQVQVKPTIGLTFANILRSVMRQDPDVIMVGEVRDKETAEIAIQAALTGHLVLTTLHTNDTVSSISRLRYMGIEPFLLADSVDLVMAQRLLSCICPNCKEEQKVPEIMLEKLNIKSTDNIKFYHGKGCDNCYDTGYKGRTSIYEVLRITPEIRKMIISQTGDIYIKEQAIKEGMETLRDLAIEKLKAGITTVSEVLTITTNG